MAQRLGNPNPQLRPRPPAASGTHFPSHPFPSLYNSSMSMLRRYLALLILALWMGGFTFFTLFVIPVGAKVLGSDRDQGFITQQVTNHLNYIGTGSLLVLGALLFTERTDRKLRLHWLAWLAMAALQAALFFLHSVIDGMLDPATHKIHDLGHFFNWHRTYMATASLQWLIALIYLWLMMRLWRKHDRQTVSVPA